jgi:VCPO second helical-bundle domain
LFTGSDTFGYSTVIPANFGRVEPGIPAVPTTVSFATFSEAAQQAGLSRLYGGIHFFDDNTLGQTLGALIGQQAYDRAQTYFNGTAP